MRCVDMRLLPVTKVTCAFDHAICSNLVASGVTRRSNLQVSAPAEMCLCQDVLHVASISCPGYSYACVRGAFFTKACWEDEVSPSPTPVARPPVQYPPASEYQRTHAILYLGARVESFSTRTAAASPSSTVQGSEEYQLESMPPLGGSGPRPDGRPDGEFVRRRKLWST